MKKSLVCLGVVIVLVVAISGLAEAQRWRLVALLDSDASPGEHIVIVRNIETIQEGREILIEARDGSVRAAYRVRHVYGHNVLLEERLGSEFVSGAKIFQ